MRYAGFISYSRRDEAFARWLFQVIETTRRPNAKSGKRTCFFDTAEIVPGPSLPKRLEDALVQSEWLIVVLSPEAAKSQWVNQEIETFARLRGPDRILGVIARGEPTERPMIGESAIPPALTAALQDNPLFADARQRRDRRRAALQILAAMDGVSVDSFLKRDVRRRTRNIIAAAAATAISLTIVAGLAWRASEAAEADQLYAQARAQFGFERIRLLVASARTAQSIPFYGRGRARADLDLPENKLLLGVIATRRDRNALRVRDDYGAFTSQAGPGPLFVSDGEGVFRLARSDSNGEGLAAGANTRMQESGGRLIGANASHLLFGGNADCNVTLVDRASGDELDVRLNDVMNSCSATLQDVLWIWSSRGELYNVGMDGATARVRAAAASNVELRLADGSPPLGASFDTQTWRLTLYDLRDDRVVSRIDLPRTGFSERPETLASLVGIVSPGKGRVALAVGVQFLTAEKRAEVQDRLNWLDAKQDTEYSQERWDETTLLSGRMNAYGNAAYVFDLASGDAITTVTEMSTNPPSWRFLEENRLIDLIYRSNQPYLRLQEFDGAPPTVVSLATGRSWLSPELSPDGRRLEHLQSEFLVEALAWDVDRAIAFFCEYQWPEVQVAADAVHRRGSGVSAGTPCA